MRDTEQAVQTQQKSPYAEDGYQEGHLNIVGFDELVPVAIAAKITGLSSRSLRRLVFDGQLPVYRYAPNSARYLVRDLVEWTEERRIEPSK
ncbi:hypothetical protein J2T57_003819 [Natronocella acetinitrilica]|uniref:Helix-turn-helix domain-containing protein n=1 Tax=Natronocella acetinitrilica TaxID=414046 RepID=A0AAE3G8Y7_9GAMM|nr:hypothetical protein [Natronocella acetinitrilica]